MQLDPATVRRLLEICQRMVRAAEDVPLGSLAQAIGRYLDCTITLWPMEQLKQLPEDERAIFYSQWNGEQREYFVFYAPTEDEHSQDAGTRYSVAHELAHILLKHPLQNGRGTPEQELEAHFLATLFLLLHGAPVERARPSPTDLVKILDNTELAEESKWWVVSTLSNFLSQSRDEVRNLTAIPSRERSPTPPGGEDLAREALDNLPADWSEDVTLAERTLDNYANDLEFREKALNNAEAARVKAFAVPYAE